MELYQTLQSLVTSNNMSWKFLIPEYSLLFFFLLGLFIDLFFHVEIAVNNIHFLHEYCSIL
jgi:hypothetical protein